MGGVLKLTKNVLLYASVLFLVIFVVSFTIDPHSWKSPGNFQSRDAGNVPKSPPKKGSLDIVQSSTCPRVMARDVVNMVKFNSHCQASHLTRLPLHLPPTDDGISAGLNLMAKQPLGASCACPRKLQLAQFPIPITGLITFPGSGTTWIRHLVQQMTGIHTGSVYRSSEEKNIGFPYEGEVNNVSLVKNHKPPDRYGYHSRKFYDKSVLHVRFHRLLLLLRNPYAAIVADYKRYNLKLGKVGNVLINTTDPKWSRHLRKKGKNWGLFIKAVFDTTLPVFIMYYEDFASCILPELVRLASYLGYERLGGFSFCCALQKNEGAYHRPPTNQTIEDLYKPEDRMVMNEVILQTASYLKKISRAEAAKTILSYMVA